MAWSIAEVAGMSSVTSRTLRHYDQIGLLAPAYVGANGYRYYEQEQLLRLQEILLLRELDLSLETIGQILEGQQDRGVALRDHQRWLRAERQRLGRLADTVARTIIQLEGGDSMTAQDLFEGFAEKREAMEARLVERHGEAVRRHFQTSAERTREWTKEDYLAAKHEGDVLDAKVLELMASGTPADAPVVFEVIAEHHASVSQFWTPARQSYAALGQLYVDDPDFRARYDAKAPGLAEYLRDAIAAYAATRLT